jgi:parallel beta-helix repeat protein
MLAGAFPFTFTLVAQAQSQSSLPASDRETISEQNIIYVNPTTGDDRVGEGSETKPFKTITQALMLAKPKTTIQLASGTYNQATGETFPIIIRSDITLKGSPSGQGYNIIIQGSGTFLSPTAAGQHVSVAAIRDAGEITGVTITNPENRGYGLWVESASPRIIGNTFTRNGNTGLSVNGKSSPQIANNYFYNNMGNGLSLYDRSQPEIKDNLFEKTGFGIIIAENTTASIANNRFTGNRIGIILQGQSQAILRNNTIEKSSESGLVAIANAQVDLGTSKEPGNNIFRSNSKVDLQNAGKGQVIAFGNEISGRTEGKIDLNGDQIAFNSSTSSPSKLPPLPIARQNVSSVNIPKKQVNSVNIPNQNRENALGNRNEFPKSLLFPSSSAINSSQSSSTTNKKELVFSAPSSNSSLPSRSSVIEERETRPINTETLPPPPPIREPKADSFDNLSDRSQTKANLDNFSNSQSDRLPVPDSFNSKPLPQSISANFARREVYRVVVEADDRDRQTQVRSLYPEAFNTNYRGKSMLQVGVFSDRDKAEAVLNSLENLGLTGAILGVRG